MYLHIAFTCVLLCTLQFSQSVETSDNKYYLSVNNIGLSKRFLLPSSRLQNKNTEYKLSPVVDNGDEFSPFLDKTRRFADSRHSALADGTSSFGLHVPIKRARRSVNQDLESDMRRVYTVLLGTGKCPIGYEKALTQSMDGNLFIFCQYSGHFTQKQYNEKKLFGQLPEGNTGYNIKENLDKSDQVIYSIRKRISNIMDKIKFSKRGPLSIQGSMSSLAGMLRSSARRPTPSRSHHDNLKYKLFLIGK